jgi:GTP-binding protein Era
MSGAEGTAPHRCGHVAVVGRPSVGKSTLVNRLVGQKLAITSSKPQTTRHRIAGILTEPGRQFVFVDTPGFQNRHRSRLNDRMNRTVVDSLAGVDVAVLVVDGARLTQADRNVAALLPAGLPVVVAVNKVDALADRKALLPLIAGIAELRPFAAIVPVSAEKGTQVDALKDEIAKLLPEGPAIYGEDEITDRDERFLAAEFVREKVFRLLGDEVPYSTAVGIDRFEHDGPLRRIFASIYVDKASQRAILLGAKGERIREIGRKARQDLEALFGGPVYLELWVRVKKGWADDEAALRRLGL